MVSTNSYVLNCAKTIVHFYQPKGMFIKRKSYQMGDSKPSLIMKFAIRYLMKAITYPA